jgi:hypothetical protein
MMPVRTAMLVRGGVREQTASPFGWKGAGTPVNRHVVTLTRF